MLFMKNICACASNHELKLCSAEPNSLYLNFIDYDCDEGRGYLTHWSLLLVQLGCKLYI